MTEVEAVAACRVPALSAPSALTWRAAAPCAIDAPVVSLLFLLWCCAPAFKLALEAFRRAASCCCVPDFVGTLGLPVLADATELPVVAEIGRRGGGMASCFAWAFSGCFSVLELLRFQDKDNFRRKVVMDDGV